jgi:hypothetical protein
MSTLGNGFFGLIAPESAGLHVGRVVSAERNGQHDNPPPGPDVEFLRRCAWEIGERRPADAYTPPDNHVGLAPVNPYQGFAHWRIRQQWVDETAWHRGNAWRDCRLVLRLYDVSYLQFTGLNAHSMRDHTLPCLCGQMFFKLTRPGTWQLAEVGFLLRSGEFVPAARSHSIPFPADAAAARSGHEALLHHPRTGLEHVGNVWDQAKILDERRRPRLRQPLRSAAFAFAARETGQDGPLAAFVSELAAGQAARGHEAHVFVAASAAFNGHRQVGGVHYHPLEVQRDGTPLDQARSFAVAAERRLRDFPGFDLVHLHEWMTGLGPWVGDCPTVLSLGSIETTRRNGGAASGLSLAIEEAERQAAQSAGCVLTPHWLRDRAAADLGLNGSLRAFPMEGRLPNEWEMPLDFGHVKMGIGLGPLDRLLLFVGPLEHAAGPDLLLEALPVLLGRAHNARAVFVGAGQMYGQLHHRAYQLGVAHAVRILGHVEGPQVTRLLRSAEALVLPSRYRVPQDDAVVDLARRAGRPVVTTHGGPAHLVRHEENGLVTYDNPGSMVWALDRILGDSGHAERMGRNGQRRGDGSSATWGEVAGHYLELCAAHFPELSETQW